MTKVWLEWLRFSLLQNYLKNNFRHHDIETANHVADKALQQTHS